MVTQRDIATRCGVSVSLVSRALSGSAGDIGVPQTTVDRIRQVAADLGYQPNVSARILKGAPTQTVGVVVYDFEDPFFGPIVGELQRLAHQRAFSLVLGGFEKRQVWELDVAALLKHQIDGLIIIGSGDAQWAAPFHKKGVPLVRIGGGHSPRGLHSVAVNEKQGVEMVVRHLKDSGRTRIAFAGGEHPSHATRQIHAASVLRQEGLPAHAPFIKISKARGADAGVECGRLLARHPARTRPDAVVAANDLVALGVLRALAEAGLRVPEDIALTGFDDIPAARLSVPSLTTVRQPVADMARAAFDHIMIMLRNGASPQRTRMFEPTLVIRESTSVRNA